MLIDVFIEIWKKPISPPLIFLSSSCLQAQKISFKAILNIAFAVSVHRGEHQGGSGGRGSEGKAWIRDFIVVFAGRNE